MSTYDFLSVRQQLAESNARFSRFLLRVLPGLSELERFFPTVNEADQEKALEYLKHYTCYAGYNNAAPATDCRTVTTPFAGKCSYRGTWRQHEVRKGSQDQQIGVYEVLRLGWLTAIVTGGVVDFSEATVVKYDPLRKELNIEWANLSADHTKAMAESIPATLSSPVIGVETYSGTWIRKGIADATISEDGSGKVTARFSTEPDNIEDDYDVSVTQFETSEKKIYRKDTRAAAVAVLTAGVVLPGPMDGTTVSGGVTRSAEGFQAELDVKKEQPVTDATIITANDLYKRRETVVNKAQPADTVTTPEDPANGIVQSIQATKTPGGLLDVETTNNAEQDVHDATVGKSITGTLAVTRYVDRGQDPNTDLTATLDTDGTITNKSGTRTPGDLLDVESEVRIPVKRESGWFTIPTRYGNARIYWGENLTTVEKDAIKAALEVIGTGAYAGYYYNPSFTARQNDHNLWDVTSSMTPFDNQAKEPDDWSNFEETWNGYKDVIINGVVKYIPTHFGIKHTSSHSAAAAFLEGQGNPEFTPLNGGRHFRAYYATFYDQPQTL